MHDGSVRIGEDALDIVAHRLRSVGIDMIVSVIKGIQLGLLTEHVVDLDRHRIIFAIRQLCVTIQPNRLGSAVEQLTVNMLTVHENTLLSGLIDIDGRIRRRGVNKGDVNTLGESLLVGIPALAAIRIAVLAFHGDVATGESLSCLHCRPFAATRRRITADLNDLRSTKVVGHRKGCETILEERHVNRITVSGHLNGISVSDCTLHTGVAGHCVGERRIRTVRLAIKYLPGCHKTGFLVKNAGNAHLGVRANTQLVGNISGISKVIRKHNIYGIIALRQNLS